MSDAAEKHRLRHVLLHEMLDELIADWARHNARPCGDLRRIKTYSNTTIMELLTWSCKQTIKPDEEEG